MKHQSIKLGGGSWLVADAGSAAIYFADGSWHELDADGLGRIAEWLAVAWENVAGEEYRPVVISERGYVAREGVIHAGEHVIPKRAMVMPGLDRLEDMIDDGNGAYSRLERDCE